jgi:tRNA(Leu) C34 or U34 (ribose-2'-O)-methylase TrmL
MSAAVVLLDPKFAINVANARRACACYGVERLIYSGSRAARELESTERTPRPMRMRAFSDAAVEHCVDPLGECSGTIVAIEVRENAEPLPLFQHPEDAVYVFGPEDGSLGRPTLMRCHRFVQIPTRHCLNLATAVATVLYDRAAKALLDDGDAKLSSTADPSATD